MHEDDGRAGTGHQPTQYQRGSRTLPTARTPVTMTTVKPITPYSGLGAEHRRLRVVITEPQASTGLILQLGTYCGF